MSHERGEVKRARNARAKSKGDARARVFRHTTRRAHLTDSLIFLRLLETAIWNSRALFGQSASSSSSAISRSARVPTKSASQGTRRQQRMPHNNGFRRPAKCRSSCFYRRDLIILRAYLTREFQISPEDDAWNASVGAAN